MSKVAMSFLAATMLVGCGMPDSTPGEASDSYRKPNCAVVLCALPLCEPGTHLETKPNQCCPQCVPDKAETCSCSGGFMDASYCGQFGSPWKWVGGACVWQANSQGGLTEEQCGAVEAKHAGDGTGSDIYNLGLECTYGKAQDCTTRGCPVGEHCDICRTIDGAAYVCLPDGAVC